MRFERDTRVRVSIPKSSLLVIFEECDKFPDAETGGRIIGNYVDLGGELRIEVSGVIESGPRARRTAVSFFQDGDYQEQVFRQLEAKDPNIEHLGNWHTHHMNGLDTLSGGDIATYQRVVNHQKHNTDFFYALLVTAKNKSSDPLQRYRIRHYFLRRGDDHIYEIPGRQVSLTDSTTVWPAAGGASPMDEVDAKSIEQSVIPDRVYDRDILAEFYPSLRPYVSESIGLYWRGKIELIDGSMLEAVVIEDQASRRPNYSIVLRDPPEPLEPTVAQLSTMIFTSARAAVLTAERVCNRSLFDAYRARTAPLN